MNSTRTYIKIILLIQLFFLLNSSKHLEYRYTITSKELIEKYNVAKKDIYKKKYDAAKKLLIRLIKANKNFLEAKLLLAYMYQRLGNTEKCKKLLDKLTPLLPKKKFEHMYYETSNLYFRCGAYKKANIVLKKVSKKKYLPEELRSKIKGLKHSLTFSLKAIKHPINFKPALLPKPLNSFAAQYFPIVSIDRETILFTGRTDYNLSAQENIYISKKTPNGKWTKPTSLSKNINTKNNEGTCTLSADGNIIIFSAHNRDENNGSCDLYVSYKKGKEWTLPKNLGPNINSKGWQSQPSLSSDGKTLFFSAHRSGNYGKKDIWKSTLDKNGKWTKSVNLGKRINTKGIEISPFIHPNGKTLFFASDRNPSLGGLDLYYSELVNGKWTKPKNLGFPINNHEDQVSLFITADGSKGYYAAGTQKGVHYNGLLYEFDIPKQLIPFPRCRFVRGKIKINKLKEFPDAKITVYDIEAKNILHTVKVTPENANFCIALNEGKKYNVIIEKKGYILENIEVDLKTNSDLQDITQNINLLKINDGYKRVFKNVFFDFDKYYLKEEGKNEIMLLAKLLESNKNINILIEGYTDNLGSKMYNSILSEKRAKSVYDYLIKLGIDSKRLSYKGCGILDTSLKTSIKNTRKISRKASFKIILKSKPSKK